MTRFNPLHKLVAILGALGALALLASVACTPATTPSHAEAAGLDDGATAVQSVDRPSFVPASVPFISTGNPADEPTHYGLELTLTKCLGQVAVCTTDQAYEVRQDHDNLLTTAGATALWNGLSTAGLATPFSTTNAQLAVGDSTTAAAVGDTDLGATAGTKLNAADLTSSPAGGACTLGGTFSPVPVVGQVVVVSGITVQTGCNGTFELSAASASSITLLNSTATGTATLTGSLVKPINYYRQQANGTGSAVVSGNQITYVATIGTTNGNFAWQEWGLTTGAAATNKEAQAPPTLFNHKIVSLGTKTSAASWMLTATLSLS